MALPIFMLQVGPVKPAGQMHLYLPCNKGMQVAPFKQGLSPDVQGLTVTLQAGPS